MICEKCGGSLSVNKKCTLCGSDNSSVDYAPVENKKVGAYRSMRVTVFMWLSIALYAILICVCLFVVFSAETTLPMKILSVFLSVFMAVEIVLCFFVLKMKKWALIAYIVLAVIDSVLQLFTLNFIPIIFRALLFYFIFRNDWEYFE